MEIVSIELDINKKIDVDIHVSDIIQAVNELPMKLRWNTIANLLNHVELGLNDLNAAQKDIVKNYLSNKLKQFEAA